MSELEGMIWKCEGEGDTHKLSGLQHPFIPLILLRSVIHRKTSPAILFDRQNTRHVATAIAIIGCRPDCDKLLVEHVLEAFLN